jgi:hypothetical protein
MKLTPLRRNGTVEENTYPATNNGPKNVCVVNLL